MANRYTDKETISHSEYLQLLGLMELTRRATLWQKSIIAAAVAIVGEKDDDALGHTADECYSENPSVESLLKRLDIKVVQP